MASKLLVSFIPDGLRTLRKANEEELDRLIGGWTAQYTGEELAERLQKAGVPAGLVATGQDLFNDPQLKHRQFWQVLEHPEIGDYTVRNLPYRLSKTPGMAYRAAPCVGEHTEYACVKLLAMKEEEFADLVTSGVLD